MIKVLLVTFVIVIGVFYFTGSLLWTALAVLFIGILLILDLAVNEAGIY